MYGRYQRAMRAQRQGSHGTSARDAATWLAVVCLVASAAFWFPIQWELTGPTRPTEAATAFSMGLFMVVGPPVVVSLFIPWSRIGRLMGRLSLTRWGQAAGAAMGLFLIWYAYQLTWAFWSSRPVVASAGLGTIQSIVGLIATIAVPALLWAPTSREELAEKMRADQEITQYEEAMRARLRLFRAAELRALRLANIGFANLTAAERAELAGYQRSLVESIDRVIVEIANDANEAAGIAERYASAIGVDDDVVNTLDYIAEALNGTVGVLPEPSPTVEEADATVEEAPSRYAASEPVKTRRAPTVTPPAGSDPGRSGIVPDHTLAIAREHLGRVVWTARDLAGVLAVEESTARKQIGIWSSGGYVRAAGMRGRYEFTESEV